MDGKNLCYTSQAKEDCPNEQSDTDVEDKLKGEGQMEVEGQMDESGDIPGVKKMVYNKQMNLIAVIYHRY